MKIIIESYYKKNLVKIVGVIFEDYTDWKPVMVVSIIENRSINSFRSGCHFMKDLPGILKLLDDQKVKEYEIDTIIINSQCVLHDVPREGLQKPGLGELLYEALDEKINVIGVARANYGSNLEKCPLVHRGKSYLPLIITSCGIHDVAAKELIESMVGPHRLPHLIKLAETISRLGI